MSATDAVWKNFGLVDYRKRVVVKVYPPGKPALAMITYGLDPSHYDKTELIIRFQRAGILLRREDIVVETLPEYKPLMLVRGYA